MLFCPYLNLTYERDRIQLNSPTSLKISFCYRPLCFCLSGPGFPSSFVESLFLLVAPCGWWGPKVGPQPSAFLVLCAVWGDLTESLVAATSLWPVPIWAPGLDLKLSRVYKHLELNMLNYKFVTGHSKPTSELAEGKRTAAYPWSQARPRAPPCTHFPQYCWWSRPTQSTSLLSSSPLLTFSPAPTRFRSPFLLGIPASGFPPFSSGLKICPLPTHPPLSIPIAFQNANLTSSCLSLKSFIDPS